jgi:hypothetical protein
VSKVIETHHGWSGAVIDIREDCVLKSSMEQNLHYQARYCKHLGEIICPRIIRPTLTGYVMERLTPMRYPKDVACADQVLLNMVDALAKHVWAHDVAPGRGNETWKEHLILWADAWVYDVRSVLKKLYPCAMLQMRIHGDPTLSNFMWRVPDKEFVIADPIEPVGKVPGLLEVDLGKMLQSALGWEALTVTGWVHLLPRHALVDAVLNGFSEVSRKRAWFWCFIHLLRTIPYSKARTRHDVVQWAEQQAKEIWNEHLVRL